MPTRLERLNRLYWTKRDIQLVLNISNEKSNYVFNEVKKIELAKSKFEAHSTKVAMKNVLKFTDNDERLLRRQIESENAQKKSSTTANQVNSNWCTAFVVHPHFTTFAYKVQEEDKL